MGGKKMRNTEEEKEKREKNGERGEEESEKYDEMMRKVKSYYTGHA